MNTNDAPCRTLNQWGTSIDGGGSASAFGQRFTADQTAAANGTPFIGVRQVRSQTMSSVALDSSPLLVSASLAFQPISNTPGPFVRPPHRSLVLERSVEPVCARKSMAHAARTPLHASPGQRDVQGCRAGALPRTNSPSMPKRVPDCPEPLPVLCSPSPVHCPGQTQGDDQHGLTNTRRWERGQQEGQSVSPEAWIEVATKSRGLSLPSLCGSGGP
jgi:hypothetical protein